jgi:hypothetical protein
MTFKWRLTITNTNNGLQVASSVASFAISAISDFANNVQLTFQEENVV